MPNAYRFLNNGDITHKSGELVVAKTEGQLVHPNKFLFEFLSSVKHSFFKHCENIDVFKKVISDVTCNI